MRRGLRGSRRSRSSTAWTSGTPSARAWVRANWFICWPKKGSTVGRHTIRRYRAEMGLSTLHPKPNLSRPSRADHRVYPYLLRGLVHRAARPSLGRGHHLHPLCAAAFCTWWRSWTGSRAWSWRGSCPTRWNCRSSCPAPRPRLGGPCPRSLTAIRAATSHLHERAVHGPRPFGRSACLDGRARALRGQHLHGAAVAQR